MHNQELLPLAARGQLLAVLQQNALQDRLETLGDWRWEADLVDGTISFVNKQDTSLRLDAGIELLASIAPGPRSLLWGWGHPQGRTDGVAAAIRDSGIAGLDTDTLAFPDGITDLEPWIAEQAHLVGYNAVAITGHGPYYSAPIGGGSRAVFFLDLPLPAPTVRDLGIKLPAILNTGLLDARTSLWSAAQHLGWNLQWTDAEFTGADVSDATSSLHVTFDEQGRITGINGTL